MSNKFLNNIKKLINNFTKKFELRAVYSLIEIIDSGINDDIDIIIPHVELTNNDELNLFQEPLVSLINYDDEYVIKNVLNSIIKPYIIKNENTLDFDEFIYNSLTRLIELNSEFSTWGNDQQFLNEINKNNNIFLILTDFIKNNNISFYPEKTLDALFETDDKNILLKYMHFILNIKDFEMAIEDQIYENWNSNPNIIDIMETIKFSNKLDQIIPKNNIKSNKSKI